MKYEIIVEPVYPPVPTRIWDWVAYLDEADNKGAYAATKWEAVRKLIDSLEDDDK